MIKVFKIVNKILLALSVVLFTVGLIIPGITLDALDTTFLSQVLSNTGVVIAAVVGSILIYSNIDTAKRVGNGLTIAAFIIGLSVALLNLNTKASPTSGKTTSSIAAVIMIVAAVILAVSYVFNLVILILNKGSTETINPTEDIRIIRIREWKQILDEGIITKEEFEEKRVQILGLNKHGKPKNGGEQS